MKRSRSIQLTLMASSALALAACQEEQVNVDVFSSVSQCVTEGGMSEDLCQSSFAEAQQEHALSGPRYESEALCEQEFGDQSCQAVQSGSQSYFMPFMTGFLVSEMLDEIGDAAHKKRRHSAPIYYSRGSTKGYFTASGARLYQGQNGTITTFARSISAKPQPAKIMTRTTVSSRGGFGASSRGFGG